MTLTARNGGATASGGEQANGAVSSSHIFIGDPRKLPLSDSLSATHLWVANRGLNKIVLVSVLIELCFVVCPSDISINGADIQK